MTRNISLFFILIILGFFLFLEFLSVPFVLESSYLAKVLSIVLVATFCFIVKREYNIRLKGQYFRVSSLFVIGFILVHFQIYVDYVVGNYQYMGHDYLIDTTIVPKSIVISSLALVAFYLGYFYRLNKSANSRNRIISNKPDIPIFSRGLVVLCYFLFILFIVNIDLRFFSGGMYGSEELGAIATYSHLYFVYAVFGIIILNSININRQDHTNISFYRYIRMQGAPLLIILAIYLPLILMSGDRGPALQIGVVFIGGYIFSQNKKLKGLYYIFLLGAGILFVSILGVARAVEMEGGSYWDRFENIGERQQSLSSSNSISPNTMELATVVRTLHVAVSYTEAYGFANGLFQAYQIVGIVPGLGTVFQNMTGKDQSELRSAEFVTGLLKADWGMGTTCVADVYLDFGIIGVIIAFLLFGYFLRYIDERSVSLGDYNLWIWVIVFLFLSQAIYIGRSTIISVFRDAFLTYIIIHISFVLNKFLVKNSK